MSCTPGISAWRIYPATRQHSERQPNARSPDPGREEESSGGRQVLWRKESVLSVLAQSSISPECGANLMGLRAIGLPLV